ncbi:MAG: hypothetical protein GVY19_12510 [Bacteroidetes bacterium]|jgi:hypothetical protein|nr:hypothetical protein [Bacteroidota bacterium]
MKTRKVILAITGMIILMLLTSASSNAMKPAHLSEATMDSLISDLIEENIIENKDKEVTLNGLYLDMAPVIYNLYMNNNFQPLWMDEANSQLVNDIYHMLENSMQFGIDPKYFSPEYLKFIQNDIACQRKVQKKAIRATQFEFLMTHTVLQLYVIMEKGVQYYEDADFYNDNDIYIQQLPDNLLQSIQRKNLVNTLLKSQPDAYSNHQNSAMNNAVIIELN